KLTLSSINTDYVNTREIIDKTETSCSKILSIIEERALSYEYAIVDAAQQIQTVTEKVPALTITNPTTQERYQVYTEKYNRAKNAAETELLTGEKEFNHLLSFLFGAIFSNKEVSSIHGTVKGTKPLCPQRVHAIDQHMYNIYSQRYSTYEQTKKFKDTINKKCCRLRARVLDTTTGIFDSIHHIVP
ncbi:unnamed protein product, partial [Didymodactylos carnosus]